MRWPLSITTGVLFVLLFWPFLSFLGLSPLWALPSGFFIAAVSFWSYFYTTRNRLRREKGLPWEEQRVVLSDEGVHATYESGFEVRIPWTKVRRTRRYPEGILLELEGRAQCFLPQRALGQEDETYLFSRLPSISR